MHMKQIILLFILFSTHCWPMQEADKAIDGELRIEDEFTLFYSENTKSHELKNICN